MCVLDVVTRAQYLQLQTILEQLQVDYRTLQDEYMTAKADSEARRANFKKLREEAQAKANDPTQTLDKRTLAILRATKTVSFLQAVTSN